MIAPPRSPSGSGRSSSRTVELRDLGRTGLRPSRRQTSQALVGYAVPAVATPRNPGPYVPVNLAPPQSGQVAIPAPVIEASSTASPPADQPSAFSTYYLPLSTGSISPPGEPSVAEATWAKVSAIATLYQAFLATIQTAGGIAFGVAAIVVGVKALQLAQLEYCEERKSDNPSVFCKLLVRAGVESTSVFRRDADVSVWEAAKPSVFLRFLAWLSAWRERLMPNRDVPRSFFGKVFKLLAWVFFLGPWEDVVEKLTGAIFLAAFMFRAFFFCFKVLVPLLAWRSGVLMQLLEGDALAPKAPRLASQNTGVRMIAAAKPLILCLAMSDGLSLAGGWALSWTGWILLSLITAVTGLCVGLSLFLRWALDPKKTWNARMGSLSGLEITGQVVLVVSLLGLAHLKERGPLIFFSLCQLGLSGGSFVVAGYHRFRWRKLASVNIDGFELIGIIHVGLSLSDIFFPNRTSLWALGVKS